MISTLVLIISLSATYANVAQADAEGLTEPIQDLSEFGQSCPLTLSRVTGKKEEVDAQDSLTPKQFNPDDFGKKEEVEAEDSQTPKPFNPDEIDIAPNKAVKACARGHISRSLRVRVQLTPEFLKAWTKLQLTFWRPDKYPTGRLFSNTVNQLGKANFTKYMKKVFICTFAIRRGWIAPQKVAITP